MTASSPNYQKHALLFVDDEPKTCKYFNRLFGDTFRILTAQSGTEGYETFRRYQDEIALVVADEVMPGGPSGEELLESIRNLKPETIRILSSGYTRDTPFPETIYAYIPKPWEIDQFTFTLKRGYEYYRTSRELASIKSKLEGILPTNELATVS